MRKKIDGKGEERVVESNQEDSQRVGRRDFLRVGALGAAGLAAGLKASPVAAQSTKAGKKRVVILFDSWNHMMPALAREMVRRNHDLVLGDARDKELVKELRKMGAKVEVVPNTEDQTKLETFQKLVDRAQEVFGGFNSACIRTGTHVNASVLTGDEKDLDTVYEGNLKTGGHQHERRRDAATTLRSALLCDARRRQRARSGHGTGGRAARSHCQRHRNRRHGIPKLPPHGGCRQGSGKGQGGGGYVPNAEVCPARGCGEFRGHPD